MTGPRDSKVPRVERGTTTVQADHWYPKDGEFGAAQRLWSRPKLRDRVATVRKAARYLVDSEDPDNRAVGYALLHSVANRTWTSWARDCGLVIAGGKHGVRGETARDWRDAELRILWRLHYSEFASNPYAAARAMLSDFAAYETRSWPRDKETRRFPQAGPSRVWADILRQEIVMPSSEQQIVNILTQNKCED